MTTTIRVQKHMANSVGALAVEHARLEREIEQMNAAQAPTPTGDDLVRALAAEIAVEEQRTAEKRAALMRAEAALQTQARERQEANAERLQERHAAAVEALQAAEAKRLAAIEGIDERMHAVAQWINEAVGALAEERAACVELATLVGRERISVHGMDDSEQRRRIAARLVAILATNVKGASMSLGREFQFSGISWTLERQDGWAEREQRLVAPDISNAVGGWRS
jgi:hypothetical protein